MAKKNKRIKKDCGALKVPLNLPAGMKLYREEAHLAAVGDRDTAQSLRCCDQTMEHFGVPLDQQEEIGDVILRLAMLLSIQPESQQLSFNPDSADLS